MKNHCNQIVPKYEEQEDDDGQEKEPKYKHDEQDEKMKRDTYSSSIESTVRIKIKKCETPDCETEQYECQCCQEVTDDEDCDAQLRRSEYEQMPLRKTSQLGGIALLSALDVEVAAAAPSAEISSQSRAAPLQPEMLRSGVALFATERRNPGLQHEKLPTEKRKCGPGGRELKETEINKSPSKMKRNTKRSNVMRRDDKNNGHPTDRDEKTNHQLDDDRNKEKQGAELRTDRFQRRRTN